MFLLETRLVMSELTLGAKHTTIWQGTKQRLGQYIKWGNTGVGHQGSAIREWLGQVTGIKQLRQRRHGTQEKQNRVLQMKAAR